MCVCVCVCVCAYFSVTFLALPVKPFLLPCPTSSPLLPPERGMSMNASRNLRTMLEDKDNMDDVEEALASAMHVRDKS